MKFPPRFQDLIPPDAVRQLVDLVAQPSLISGIKDAATKLGWKEHWNPTQFQDAMHQAKRWVESVADRFQPESTNLKNCINATGEIFSSRFLSTPLSAEAIRAQAMVQEGFVQGKLLHDYESIFRDLTGCEEVVVISSLPQAIRLLGHISQAQSGWIIPKSDCIRLPRSSLGSNSIDLRDLLGTFGAPIHEVGAINECTLADMEAPLISGAKGIIAVEQPDASGKNREHRAMILGAAKKSSAIYCELLLAGSLHRLEFLSPEPTLLRDRVESGVDIIALAGNGLIGGPACGVLLGKSSYLAPLKTYAAKTGLELDAPTLAAWNHSLEQTKTIEQWKQGSIGMLMTTSLANLNNRAKRIAAQLNGGEWIKSVHVENRSTPIGNGPWKETLLESSLVVAELHEKSIQAAQDALANSARPIVVNWDGGRIEFILRTVDASEDHWIVESLRPLDA